MRCETFETRIDQVLDQRLPLEVDRDLAQHAASCSACREILSAHEALFKGIAQRAPLELSEGLADRVLADPLLANLEAQADAKTVSSRQDGLQKPGAPRKLLPWLAPLVTAASVMLAAYLIFADREGDNGTSPVASDDALGNSFDSEGLAFSAAFDGIDTKRFQVNKENFVLMGYATGRTMARLPQKMQLAASNSVSATLEAIHRSSNNRPIKQEPQEPRQNKTSIHLLPGNVSRAIV